MSILEKLGLKKEKKEPVAARIRRGGDEAAPKESGLPRPARKDTGLAHQILLRPVLSEKGTHLAGRGEYVFVVAPRANKSEIRKAIQAVYGVQVRAVKILKMPSKTRRYGRTVGHTSAFKKALVKLRPGEKIPGIIEAVG